MRREEEGGRTRREGPWARGPCRDHSVPTRRAGRFRSVSRTPSGAATTRRCAAVRQRERGCLPRGIGERTCPWEREDTARSLSATSRVLIVLLVARCESWPATTGRRRTRLGKCSGERCRESSFFLFFPRGPDLAETGAASSSTPPSLSSGCRSLREVVSRGISRDHSAILRGPQPAIFDTSKERR